MKLGRKPYTPKQKDLLYKTYKSTTLPPIPSSFGHQNLISNWGMMGNDTVGDCVFAGGDHETMLWTAEGSTQANFTSSTAISDYSAVTGYDPSNPNSDQGTIVRTALEYRRITGLIDTKGKRHKIGAYLLLEQSNLLNELLESVYLFSVVGVGINFPSSAMQQFNNNQVWSVVKGSTIEGGHYIPIIAYDSEYLYCVTWGKLQPMTYDFFNTYCEEAWAILSTEFLNGQGLSPEGFNLTQLQADLNALANAQPQPTYTLSIKATNTTIEINKGVSITVTAFANNVGIPNQNITIKAQINDGSYLVNETVLSDSYGQGIVTILDNKVTTPQIVKFIASCVTPDNQNLTQEVDVNWIEPVPVNNKLWHVQTLPIPSTKTDEIQKQIDQLKTLGFDVYSTISNQIVANSTEELAKANSDKLTKAGIANIILYY